ncbi:MAG: hypothetical protein JWN86_1274 [Planctomycetota bacterium]|nr:hypothetical protein [Planctomycetota bacterium]
MSEPTPTKDAPAAGSLLDPKMREHTEGLSIEVGGDADVDSRLAKIELAGEEVAAGWKPTPHQPLSPEVRYLHVSRTIHQLITDRNRSVGIFLFVASVLFGASTALLNAPERVRPMIPLDAIQYWALPVTFAVLAIIGAFMSLILIRTRIGLIYEVAKMNALLGLPTTRVKRVNPLSIFFLMHGLVVLLGGASAGLMAGMFAYRADSAPIAIGLAVGIGYGIIFQTAYYLTILQATSETKLQNAKA